MTTSLNRVRVCQTAPICANHTRGSTGRKGDSLMATAAIGAVHLVAVGEPSGNYRKTTERIKRWEKGVRVTKYDGPCLKHSIRHRRAR